MKRFIVALFAIVLIAGFVVAMSTTVNAADSRKADKKEIIELFSGKTVKFEKWGSNFGVSIAVDASGTAEVNNEKVGWKAKDNGMFCIGEKGKTKMWGCKKIMIYEDGKVFSKGSRDETSGWITIE